MGIEQPKFNPYDDKYKKVADLPKMEQESFVDYKNGFITKEAAQINADDEKIAKVINKNKSITEKIFEKNKTAKDIAEEKAIWIGYELESESYADKAGAKKVGNEKNEKNGRESIKENRLSDFKEMYGNIPITDRSPEVYYRLFDLENPEDISKFFKDKVVLDLGAGLSEFVGDLKNKHITEKAYAVDFLYGILDKVSSPQKSRGESLPPKENRISARLQELPVGDNSVDIAVASKSFPLHAQTKKDITDFFDELVRVLKPGGEARVTPVKCFNQWMSRPTNLRERLLPKKRLADIDRWTLEKESKHLGLSEYEYLIFLRDRYNQAEEWTKECIQELKKNPGLEVEVIKPKTFAAKPGIRKEKDLLIIRKK